MSLNIKNPRVHALARQAAEVTGKTQTGAIEEALMRLLAEYGEDTADRAAMAKIDLVRPIIDAYVADPGHPHDIQAPEDLYDPATGLPR